MNKADAFQQILTKEVSRKEFLQHIGVFIVGAIGITAFMNQFFKMAGTQPQKSQSNPLQTNSYGARPYGQ